MDTKQHFLSLLPSVWAADPGEYDTGGGHPRPLPAVTLGQEDSYALPPAHAKATCTQPTCPPNPPCARGEGKEGSEAREAETQKPAASHRLGGCAHLSIPT